MPSPSVPLWPPTALMSYPCLKQPLDALSVESCLLKYANIHACGSSVLHRRYTEAGLKGLSSLKTKDPQVADVLQAVAARGCLDV